MNALGAQVRAARKARGLNLTELGDLTGVAKSYLHRLENADEVRPGFDVIMRVVAVLNIDPWDLAEEAYDLRYAGPARMCPGCSQLIAGDVAAGG
jgi:transcriptional regulator with XRE-family HTH domain